MPPSTLTTCRRPAGSLRALGRIEHPRRRRAKTRCPNSRPAPAERARCCDPRRAAARRRPCMPPSDSTQARYRPSREVAASIAVPLSVRRSMVTRVGRAIRWKPRSLAHQTASTSGTIPAAPASRRRHGTRRPPRDASPPPCRRSRPRRSCESSLHRLIPIVGTLRETLADHRLQTARAGAARPSARLLSRESASASRTTSSPETRVAR